MIAVTGAAGFIGREIVAHLRAAGVPVRAIVRDPQRARWLAERHGAELFRGNVIDAPSLEGALEGVRGVIHLVGIIRERRESTFERVHTEATVNLVGLARRSKVNRFIHMSALGTRAEGRSRYHQTKWAGEEAVRQSGLAWTIFRPSLVYGPGDEAINVLAQVVRRLPVVPVLGSGRSLVQPVAVEVVAQVFVRALHNDDTIQQTYDLCGPRAFTWDELYSKLMAALGIHKPLLHLPLPIARVQAAIFEALLPNPPFTRDQLIMTQEDNVGNPEPAERDLGLVQEPFCAGLARYLHP